MNSETDLQRARFNAERALILHDDLDDAATLGLLSASTDEADRRKAAAAGFQTKLRSATDSLAGLIESQGFASQPDIQLLLQLAQIAQNELALARVLKGLGIRHARSGNFEQAIAHLEQAQVKAAELSSRGTRRSPAAKNYLNDREIDEAYERLASMIQLDRRPEPRNTLLRCVIVISGVVDENPVGPFALAVALALRAADFDVRLLNTGFTRAPGSDTARAYAHEGFLVDDVPSGTYEQRLSFIADYFLKHAPQAAFYLVFPMDGIAKILECLRLAPAQLHNSVLYEPFCGAFDFVLFNNEVQLKTARKPQIARYVGSGPFRAAEIDEEQPFDRASLGIPKDGVLFGTGGRLAKLCGPYLDASISLLQREPTALLALAGPSYAAEQQLLESAYAAAGVRERVFFLGPRQRQSGAFLKMLDVYLDSFPEGGAQALFEAMWCGVPIVSMADVRYPVNGPEIQYSYAPERLRPIVELAKPLDVSDYVRIAGKYASSPEARKRDGALIYERARAQYDPWRAARRMAEFTREAALRYTGG